MPLPILPLLLACGSPPQPETVPQAPLVRIGGSDTINANLMPALTSGHASGKGNLRFEVISGGTGKGMRALLDGRVDIATATRQHLPSEAEQATADGTSLEKQVFGLDVVALTVHEDSPLQSLTYDQVIGIFCAGTIDDLKFIDPKLKGPIRPLTRDLGSGTRALFEDFFCGPVGIHPDIEVSSTADIRVALESDPTVVTFDTMTDASGRALALQADHASAPVEPSQKHISNGSYPLHRDLYLYTLGKAEGSTAAFIDWVLSPAGQEVVDEQFFVPIYHRTNVFDGPRPLRETVHFEADSSEPNQRSLARIQLLIQELRQRTGKGQHIVLEGFTDNRESAALDLSVQRAETVKDILESELEGTFFEIIPRGAIRPLAPNNTPYGRTRNRRVQIYLADEEEAPDLVVTPQ